ncbi:SGNH/GDSL hydrolase family protein [Streptococcus pluranimalium]|uniref:SGNH/GDSL hydrolase family protein n=1 Tax=Streptococcus pluranimalium TaxID=82348 RepID=UPI003F6900F2
MIEVIKPELAKYHQQKLRAYQAANERDPKDAVVFTGDSIIDFFPLKKFLGRDQVLLNRGIAGTDTNWLKDYLKEQVLALEPDKLFILIGTNDLGLGYDDEHIFRNIETILQTIQFESIATKVYLLSILPVSHKKEYQAKVKIRNNNDIQVLNRQFEGQLLAEYIDLYPHLLDEEGNLADEFTTDGLHLSQKGYAIIAEQLKPYLDS